MATLLTFISANLLPTPIYAEFLQSRLAPDQVLYSASALPQALAHSLCSTVTEEANWTGDIAARLAEAEKHPAVHVVTQEEFERVFELMMDRRPQKEIVVEGTRETPILTEREEWEWFYKHWQRKPQSQEESKSLSPPPSLQTAAFCTLRELPPTDQYRIYVLNLSAAPLPSVSLYSGVSGNYQALLPLCTLPTGPSILLYSQRPQGKVYLSLWSDTQFLCGLWVYS